MSSDNVSSRDNAVIFGEALNKCIRPGHFHEGSRHGFYMCEDKKSQFGVWYYHGHKPVSLIPTAFSIELKSLPTFVNNAATLLS